jgi:predicted hydrocarbon binding protein
MNITNKIDRDPVTEVPQVDAYIRWALIAIEEMVGTQDLKSMLQANKLDRLIGNYPPENLKVSHNITHKDYANLCVGLLNYYGKDGKNQSIRFGRIATKPAIEKQGKLFNMTVTTAVKFLPFSLQVKTALDSIKNDLEKIYKEVEYDVSVSIEDRGDRWAYIDTSCAICAGKEADAPICWSWVGTLEESVRWLTGKEVAVDQVKCRAMGDSACVWEISKTPKH